MKKHGTLILMLMALIASFIFSGTVSAANTNEDNPVKVGLYYGNDALPSANLANEVGSGYSLGFYDSNRVFQSVYKITDEKISVLKDKTIYLASDYSYTDTKPSKTTGAVYAYHIQLSDAVSTMNDAVSEAEALEKLTGAHAFPAYIDGKPTVRVGMYETLSKAESAASSFSGSTGRKFKAVGGSKTCYTVTVTKSEKILFEFDSESRPLGIKPISTGDSITWFKSREYYGGFEYKRVNGNDITVINVVPLQSYTKGVIPYEMSSSWPAEALKAQALCAKSYAMACKNKHSTYGFDVCNTADCQVYRGTGSATAYTDSLVDDVAGKFVTYKGKHITPYYHASNGGATEDSENVWSEAVPYLRGVEDHFEDLEKSYNGIWSYDVDFDKVTAQLKAKGAGNGQIVDIYIDKYTRMGNVYTVTFVDSAGKKYSYSKDKARTVLSSLYTHSQRYSINSKLTLSVNKPSSTLPSSLQRTYAIGSGKTIKNIVPSYNDLKVISAKGISGVTGASGGKVSLVIDGTGWGHNVGMSQEGAKGMALRGYKYDDILKFYYTGVEITSIG